MRYFRNEAESIEIQNRLKNIFKKSFINRETVSFYDWECPPRQIKTERDGSKWVNFNIDLKSVVAGKKLDRYTELPKIVSKTKLIKEILKALDASRLKYKFYMLVADTNALYLYPDSVKKIGYDRVKKLSLHFQNLLQKKSNIFYGQNKIRVVLYTDLQGKFKEEYERSFGVINHDLNSKRNSIVPQNILKEWYKYLIGHVGLTKDLEKQKEDLVKRVIASYAAEGIVFRLLDKSKVFPNPVWINLEEPFFSGATTELLRERQGISPFPKIYFKKKGL